MNPRRRGLTLAELLVVISLILLGLSVVVVNLHRRPAGAQGSMGLAKQLVAELRGVRSKARSTGSPRALCIPSNGGVTPCSQSYYLLHGHGKTAPRLVVDTSRDFPDTYLFVGICTPSTIGSSNLNPPAFMVASWLNPVIRDFVLTFTSDGKFYTNDLPHDSAGNTYVVVSDGLGYVSASAPSGTATMGSSPPPYFSLTRANQPWIVKISSSGAIGLSQDFGNSGSTVAISNSQPSAPSTAPAPPVVRTIATTAPVIEDIVSQPAANPAYNPPFETTVPPDGRVSLTLMAYDVDGDDLTYNFSSVGEDTPEPGNFTYPNGIRTLQYPNNGAQGQAKVDWVPPATAVTGDRFDLNAVVTDETGLSVTSTGRVTVEVNVKVIQAGTIAYDSNGDIYRMRGDGTTPKRLGPGQWPSLSPDGLRIAFVWNKLQTYTPPGGGAPVSESVKRIWTMNSDGSNLQRVTKADNSNLANWNATRNTNDDCPCWSPDGTKIVFARTSNGAPSSTKLQIVNANGSWVKKDLTTGTAPSWSGVDPGDGMVIAYHDTSTGKMARIKPDGSASLQLIAGNMPVWRRDGAGLLYLSGGNLNECKPDGSANNLKCTGPIGRVAINPKGTEFVGVAGSWPDLYQDPGLAAPATVNTFRPITAVFPFDGILSWSAGR
ncbi:PD40 domain-containing protein [bacterium]|nr:PD40 domain-containing protein [bacterium]